MILAIGIFFLSWRNNQLYIVLQSSNQRSAFPRREDSQVDAERLCFATEKYAGLPIRGQGKQLKTTKCVPGPVNRKGRAELGWGHGEPRQPLGTPAAMFVLLTPDPVQTGIQAAKAKGRERLSRCHVGPGAPQLSLSQLPK